MASESIKVPSENIRLEVYSRPAKEFTNKMDDLFAAEWEYLIENGWRRDDRGPALRWISPIGKKLHTQRAAVEHQKDLDYALWDDEEKEEHNLNFDVEH